ncbi:MAG: cytochrome-c peroxidase [Deltaproteobacteria bacterium HGW-Deltaproteobacteria-14]|jgi:cytochrome c peroxidase|nr:MAG: cytochrome-c peroxidase [Deltaproteobacteria bacterium HGW-Deltaproteobacteria-14]
MHRRVAGHPALFALTLTCLMPTAACGDTAEDVDAQLATLVAAYDVAPLPAKPAYDAELVELGRLLFFDPVLSGNRDISCATCHHTRLGTGDELSVSVGTGGHGLGADRVLGAGRTLVPRNAPEIYNRGYALWTTMFWDMRVAHRADGTFATPAGAQLPSGLSHVLEMQAMFPVTSRDEMRGGVDDVDVDGQPNELGQVDDSDLTTMWDLLIQRVLSFDEYADRFARAFPDVAPAKLGFQHAAKAIAAFEADAFTFTDAPFDRWLRGDRGAMSAQAKRGAVIFYGKGDCASCHGGTLMTDQRAHSLCAPQIGPGKGDAAPWDVGREAITADPQDRFAFRTPPLRNVDHTAPYMHDGAYTTLEAAVRHHLDPIAALEGYDTSALRGDVAETFQHSADLMQQMLATLPEQLRTPMHLSDAEVSDLVVFLGALTDPASLRLGQLRPVAVPSGLPVD